MYGDDDVARMPTPASKKCSAKANPAEAFFFFFLWRAWKRSQRAPSWKCVTEGEACGTKSDRCLCKERDRAMCAWWREGAM